MTHSPTNPPTDSAFIRVYGARQHNLKNIDVAIPRGSFTVITGLSGSGKSSLAFDTIYAEGRRKYVESLSVHARQFLEQMQRPDVDRIEGLPPTIAIEQRTTGAGPRSTVATTTEIYDYLRVLFARTATPTCWVCAREIIKQTVTQMVEAILQQPEGRRILILAPIITKQKGNHRATIDRLIKEGYVRARVNGDTIVLEDAPQLSPGKKHTIEVVVDRLTVKHEIRQRLADSLELATRMGNGLVIISAETEKDKWTDLPFSSTLACPEHPDVRVPELTPQLFSFNSPLGACEECHGLGTTLEFDPELVVPDANKSLRSGAIAAWRGQGKTLTAHYNELIQQFCNRYSVLPDIPFRNIPPAKRDILLHGSEPRTSVRADSDQTEPRPSGSGQQDISALETRKATNRPPSQEGPQGGKDKRTSSAPEFLHPHPDPLPEREREKGDAQNFEGIIPNLRRRFAEAKADSARALLREFMTESPCPSCQGARLNRQALSAKITGLSIADITRLSIAQADDFFREPSKTEPRPSGSGQEDMVDRRISDEPNRPPPSGGTTGG